MNSDTLKAMAVKHLDDGEKVFEIEHFKKPVYLEISKIVPSNVSLIFPLWFEWYWS